MNDKLLYFPDIHHVQKFLCSKPIHEAILSPTATSDAQEIREPEMKAEMEIREQSHRRRKLPLLPFRIVPVARGRNIQTNQKSRTNKREIHKLIS